MNRRIKIGGSFNLFWLFALAVILVTGVLLVKEARERIDDAVTVFASGGEYTPPNSSFADLLR